ncbi:ABC transporter permease [Lentimicrobium sp. S6]|uniref:ABC transporter permease n=1 Tax=Lentimicrobium sp. S6 TaxID=2735872 RepID=UPI0015562390|nr:ABC transporter permease [Lentimicrobium sp. S6]NPD46624.1 FtsX-like permease family protein [Lentimicrobium sp. S6]
MMLIKSISLSIKRLWSFKLYSIISIMGLSLAMAVALAIFSYTSHHASYDRFIENGENAYRLVSRLGDGNYNTSTFAALQDVIEEDVNVISSTTCHTYHSIEELDVEGEKYKIDHAIFINSSFLDFYSISLILGDYRSIDEPNMVFLTQKMADRVFPQESAIGKQVFVRSFSAHQDSLIAFTVGGIVEEMPMNSHLSYEVLFSQSGHFSPTVEAVKSRKVFAAAIYLKLREGADIEVFESGLRERAEVRLENAPGPPMEAFNFHLQPIFDIHFTAGLTGEMKPTVRESSHQVLIIIGYLILALAILNFVIMHIAKASFYRKANFMMRSMGAFKNQILFQTFSEIFISVFFSLILAIYLLASFQGLFGADYFGDFKISFFSFNFISLCLLSLLLLSLIISLIASSDLVKKESLLSEIKLKSKRKFAVILLIFQFTAVIGLIGFTLLINKQIDFIQNKDLGYNSEQTLVIKVPQNNEKINILKQELKNDKAVISAAAVRHYPGYRLQDMTFSNAEDSFPFKFGFIEADALETLDIPVIQYFHPDKERAKGGWYINETFYHQLQQKYSEEQISSSQFPVDENAEDRGEQEFLILGVIGDFHYESLHHNIESFAFHIPDDERMGFRFVLVKFFHNEAHRLIKLVEQKLAEVFPGQPVRYHFMQEEVQEQYESESVLLKLINTFSILSILIACFGLIGLSVFISEQRTKEIGIRKVNGASISEVLLLLLKDVVIWISVSFILATPLSYFAMRKWLENFAYKTDISWWIFLLSAAIAFVIALITVSWQTIKAARKNPIEALRYE